MQNKTTVTLMLCWMLALTGCTTTNEVLFVTKTSLGIDFDAKPATASIGYDRIEGYIAPRYANGEIPPVVASIKSDGGIFNPRISQVYATGDAAVIAVSADQSKNEKKPEKKLQGDKELMFFGTNTSTGLKVGFTSYVPDSFVFGFKRKEYSFIPLGKAVDKAGKDYDVYPSVLASIDTAANVSTTGEIDKTSLSNSQFFATGQAARKLAANPGVNQAFRKLATQSLRAEEQKKKVLAEDDKINKIVEHFTDTNDLLKADELKRAVDVLIEDNKIEESAGEMLKAKANTIGKLRDSLEGNFEGLGEPLCRSLKEQCK